MTASHTKRGRHVAAGLAAAGGLLMTMWPSAAGATVRDLSRTDQATYTDGQGRQITCTIDSRQVFDDSEEYVQVSTRIRPAPGCDGYAHVFVTYRDRHGESRTLSLSGHMTVSAWTHPGVASIDKSIHHASFTGCGGCTSEQYLLPK